MAERRSMLARRSEIVLAPGPAGERQCSPRWRCRASERRADQHGIAQLLMVEDPYDEPVVEHRHPVAKAEQLLHIGRVIKDRRSIFGQFEHNPVDLLFGPDVNATRYVVQQEDVAVGQEPLPDDHLLLVAPAQPAYGLAQAGGDDVQTAHDVSGGAPFGPSGQHSPARKRAQRGQRNVLAHAPA